MLLVHLHKRSSRPTSINAVKCSRVMDSRRTNSPSRIIGSIFIFSFCKIEKERLRPPFSTFSLFHFYPIDIVVHRELQWVRSQPERSDLIFTFVRDPAVD